MSKTRRHLLDFSGAASASFLATAADGVAYAILIALGSHVFEPSYWIGVSAGLAAIVGGIIHFSICRFWVFRRFDAPLSSSIPRYVLMSGLAAVIHGTATQLIASAGAGESWAWFISKALIYVFWTYPLSRYAVFEIRGQERGTSNT